MKISKPKSARARAIETAPPGRRDRVRASLSGQRAQPTDAENRADSAYLAELARTHAWMRARRVVQDLGMVVEILRAEESGGPSEARERRLSELAARLETKVSHLRSAYQRERHRRTTKRIIYAMADRALVQPTGETLRKHDEALERRVRVAWRARARATGASLDSGAFADNNVSPSVLGAERSLIHRKQRKDLVMAGHQINIRVDDDLAKRLDAYTQEKAKALRAIVGSATLDRADAIRELLREGLERHEAAQPKPKRRR